MVMTGDGGLVEVQATAERTPLSRASLDELLALAEGGIAKLREAQRQVSRPPRRLSAMGAPDQSLIVATRNAHKLAELGEILTGFELMPLPDEVELPPEDGETFAENALIKARAARDATGTAAIADDSGIAAAALGGRPGRALGPLRRARTRPTRRTSRCCSTRFAADGDRSVAYVCAIAFVGEDGSRAGLRGALRGARSRTSRAAAAASATTRPSSRSTPATATSGRWPS